MLVVSLGLSAPGPSPAVPRRNCSSCFHPRYRSPFVYTTLGTWTSW
jgi:hypothetical protein